MQANGGDDDHVVRVNGDRLLCEKTDTDMAKRTRRACKRAKVTELAFHELRASYATIAANLGFPLALLRAALGHADIATTAITCGPTRRTPRSNLGCCSVVPLGTPLS
jgi:integrase